MLSKFETKSARVKGLAFHSKRPWILASLHNGTIQLWDYHHKVMIERFDQEHERHEGPVRGIDFHKHQPLFVSGGDDHKIKVWSYKSRRCLFTLLGHSDYIRTAFFHHEYPWILSASDDQTIRIWNWQSRTCICVLTGHNHYVMCAQFHPTQDLIVSCAIDQYIRIWDVSGLRKKNVSPSSAETISSARSLAAGGGISSINITGPELLSHPDAIVKHAVDGHNSEVNWVVFHPNPDKYPLIVSGADDNLVKVWRYNSERCWEVDSCRGHYNNVTCCLFHPRKDLILSISEDRSIRVWDLTKRIALDTHRRENDRFWILTAHPNQNLFAAGHDTGLLLFKLERERPAFTVHDNNIYHIKDNYLIKTKIVSDKSGPVLQRPTPIMKLRARGEVGHPINAMHYNPMSNSLLISIRPSVSKDIEKSTYDLYNLPSPSVPVDFSRAANSKRAAGISAVFVGRDRFAVLDKSRKLVMRNIQSGEEIKLKYELAPCDEIFYAGSGRLFIKRSDSLVLFDTAQGIEKAKIKVTDVKSIVQNHDFSLVAIIRKEQIIICNNELQQKCVVKEGTKIKSAAWDESGVLIYTTPMQIKYTLTNGDNGTIRTIERAVYICCVRNDVDANATNVVCLDRDCTIRIMKFDPTDYKFKQALVNRDRGEILRIIKNNKLIGQAPIAYLQRKGYPEIALHFVEDDRTRFQLALDCCNIDEALKSATKLNDLALWSQLADAAMRQGNQITAAICYRKMERYDRLTMLYFVTGQLDKVQEQMLEARKRGDLSLAAHWAIMLREWEELATLLHSCGQLALAYAVAIKYRLRDLATEYHAQLNDAQRSNLPPLEELDEPASHHLKPLRMVPIRDNWPLLKVSRGFFDEALSLTTGASAAAEVDFEVDADIDAWGEVDNEDGDNENIAFDSPQDELELDDGEMNDDEVGEWYNIDDQDDVLDELETNGLDADGNEVSKGKGINGPFVAPSHGMPPTDAWLHSEHVVDHVLAGDFSGALRMLNKNVSVVEAKPFKPIFMELLARSKCKYRGITFMPSLVSYPLRSPDRPDGFFRLDELNRRLKECYALTNGGPDKFADAIENFQELILRCLFHIPDEPDKDSSKIVDICREYTLGLMCEVERRKLATSDSYEDRRRSCELVSYFTHCELGPSHRALALGLALTVFAKSREFTKTKAANSVARRLLETGASIKPQLKANAEKLKAMYDLSADQQNRLDYDEHNPFVLCAAELKPIYQGRPKATCPLCHASYQPSHKGLTCRVCRVSRVG